MKSLRFIVIGVACALVSLAQSRAWAAGGESTAGATAARAGSAPRSAAGACAASAPSTRRASSKLRHVPDEGAPCAGTSGLRTDGAAAMPESLRRAREAAGTMPASAPTR